MKLVSGSETSHNVKIQKVRVHDSLPFTYFKVIFLILLNNLKTLFFSKNDKHWKGENNIELK